MLNRHSVRATLALVSTVFFLLGSLALAQVADEAADAPAAPVKVVKTAVTKTAVKKKGEKTPAKKDAKKKPANPLQNLVRGIFGGGKKKPVGQLIPQNPANKAAPGNVKDPANGDNTSRDRVDARAPHDPAIAKLLRRAESMMATARATNENTQWDHAMEIIKVILSPTKKEAALRTELNPLIRMPDGELRLARWEANRLLGEFPESYLENYRAEFDGVARAKLEEAKRKGDTEKLMEVAIETFQTPAGRDAANFLGTLHYDRAEFGLAARWFGRLLDAKASFTAESGWLLKAALAHHLSGDTKKRDELLKQLEADPQLELLVGGDRVQPRKFIDEVGARAMAHTPGLDDWPMFYGTAPRVGKAVAGTPLLLKRWHHPLTMQPKNVQTTRDLVDDLTDLGRAAVPAFTPIMVNGKIVFRTLSGVRVVDAGNGRALWETRAGLSPDQLLSGVQPQQPMYVDQMGWGGPFGGGMMVSGNMAYHGGNADYHQLTSLLFRDGAWGTIASDGQQLFVLEDHAVMSNFQPGYSRWAFQNGNQDPYRRDFSSNKIVSYDLDTGRPRWEVGGTAMDEPFDRRLAGYYFFGVPAADGRELYAIGEKDNEIRLFVLESETGRPKWSQLLAYSDVPIQKDFGRRWWTSQVAAGNGMLVCPTTVGWLLGVDRMNHSVMWAYRYSNPKTQSRNHNSSRENNGVPQTSLNTRWSPSAPVIVGGRVVFTPPETELNESPTLVCLDLYSGKRLWQQPKGDGLYLAGVYDDRVLVVGTGTVKSYKLADGKVDWQLSLTGKQTAGKKMPPQPAHDHGHGHVLQQKIRVINGQAQAFTMYSSGATASSFSAGAGFTSPSGRGIAVGDVYHLPLRSGQLWSIDMNKGKVLAKSYLPEGGQPLGNLGMYRGMMLSLSPFGMTAFEQREEILAKIKSKKAKDPNDAWALFHEARIELLHRNYKAALPILRKVDAKALDAANAQRYQDGMVESLAALIQSDFTAHDSEFAELGAIVKSDKEKLLFRRLTAERMQARGELLAAFDIYMELTAAGDKSMIARYDNSKVKVKLSRWVVGRLKSLWDGSTGEMRTRLDERIRAEAEAAVLDGIDAQERFLSLYGFHPHSVKLHLQTSEAHAAAGDMARAQNHLIRLTHHEDPAVAANAYRRLAELCARFGLGRDAGFYYGQLVERFPKQHLEAGKTSQMFIEELRAAGKLVQLPIEKADWSGNEIELTRTGSNYSSGTQIYELQDGPYRLPFYQQRRFQFYYSRQQLLMRSAKDDNLEWVVPLRMQKDASQGNYASSETSGHLLFLLHYGVMHALSPVDRSVLWTASVDGMRKPGSFYRSASRQNPVQMQNQSSMQYGNFLRTRTNRTGMLAVANYDYVCLHGRRQFTVLDALTGDVRWKLTRVPRGVQVYGTDKAIFVVHQNNSQAAAFNPLDGSPLPIKNLHELLQKTIFMAPGSFVVADKTSSRSLLGLRGGNVEIKCIDPLTNREVWKHACPDNSYFSMADDDHLAILQTKGKFETVNLHTGQVTTMTGLTEANLKSKSERYSMSDMEHTYLIVNEQQRSYSYYGSSLGSLRVNGTVYAFNRKTGKLNWKHKVENTNIITHYFTNLPMLLFTSRKYERKGNFGYYSTSLLGLDKATGKALVNSNAASDYSSFNSMKLDLAKRKIELRSYNMRMRISVATGKPAIAERAPAVAERE